MIKLKKGDRINRQLGPDDNNVIMPMIIRKVEDGLIYCEAEGTHNWPDDELWRFEELTGAEYDPDLHWGSEWGGTGSKLVGPVREPIKYN